MTSPIFIGSALMLLVLTQGQVVQQAQMDSLRIDRDTHVYIGAEKFMTFRSGRIPWLRASFDTIRISRSDSSLFVVGRVYDANDNAKPLVERVQLLVGDFQEHYEDNVRSASIKIRHRLTTDSTGIFRASFTITSTDALCFTSPEPIHVADTTVHVGFAASAIYDIGRLLD